MPNKQWKDMTREEKDKHNACLRRYKAKNREKFSQKNKAYRQTEKYKQSRNAYFERTKLQRAEVRRVYQRKHPRETRLREALINIYHNSCAYCNLSWNEYQQLVPGAIWHMDHIIPSAVGGTDAKSNRALACQFCNYAKHNVSKEVFLRWLNS